MLSSVYMRKGQLQKQLPEGVYLEVNNDSTRFIEQSVDDLTMTLILSALAPAPLAAPITSDAGIAATAQAPWFFLWVQELLKLGSPFLWGVVVPLAVLLAITLIPYVLPKPAEAELGKWFPKGNWLAQVFFAAIILAILVLTVLALLPMS